MIKVLCCYRQAELGRWAKAKSSTMKDRKCMKSGEEAGDSDFVVLVWRYEGGGLFFSLQGILFGVTVGLCFGWFLGGLVGLDWR